MKIIAANLFPACCLAACVYFVATDHAYFGIACLLLAAITAHTFGDNQ